MPGGMAVYSLEVASLMKNSPEVEHLEFDLMKHLMLKKLIKCN